MGIAFWISSNGEIITVSTSHIHEINKHPVKFGLNSQYINHLYDLNGEKIGVEGVARKIILLHLFENGWIRIRKYGDQFWSVNVKSLENNRSKAYLCKWSQKMLRGCSLYQELDPYIPVKIDLKDKPMETYTISTIAYSDDFKTENYQNYDVVFKKAEEMEDLPLYDFVVEELTNS